MNDQTTHVLLIEDNPGDADLVRLRLIESQSPVDVNCVDRLSDGLASLSKQRPSLVLLDLNLPDSRGAETFRRVLEQAPDVPVVILSGQDDEGLAMKALHQGVQDYLVKGDITSAGAGTRHALCGGTAGASALAGDRPQAAAGVQEPVSLSRFARTAHAAHLHSPVRHFLLDGLAGGTASPEQYDHLKTLLKSVNQLHAMIRDLLEATRAETGNCAWNPAVSQSRN